MVRSAQITLAFLLLFAAGCASAKVVREGPAGLIPGRKGD